LYGSFFPIKGSKSDIDQDDKALVISLLIFRQAAVLYKPVEAPESQVVKIDASKVLLNLFYIRLKKL